MTPPVSSHSARDAQYLNDEAGMPADSVECRVDCRRRKDQEKSVAVGRRSYGYFGGYIGTSARAVLDNEWLAEPLR
jgi:hypothetical protein